MSHSLNAQELHLARTQKLAMATVALAGLVLALVVSGLVYQAESRHLERASRLALRFEATALDAELMRLSTVTERIANDGPATRALMKLGLGLLGRVETRALNRAVLEHALAANPEALGITRLMDDGTPLVELGEPVPESMVARLIDELEEQGTVSKSGPWALAERDRIVLCTPIRASGGALLGVDLVIFDASGLHGIVNAFHAMHQGTVANMVIRNTADGPEFGFGASGSMDWLHRPEVIAAIHDARAKQPIGRVQPSSVGGGHVLFRTLLPRFDLELVHLAEVGGFYRAASRYAAWTAGFTLTLGVLTLLVIRRLLRPVLRRIGEQTDELHGLLEQREQLLDSVRTSEERFDLAMRAANDGLWDWEFKTGKVYYSPRWMSMLGYAENELPAHLDTWSSLITPEDGERTLTVIREAMHDGTDAFGIDFRMRHKDGHWVDILSRGMVLRDAEGEPVRVVGTHVDISQRVSTRKALEASEKRLRAERDFVNAVVEATGTVIVVTDPEGNIIRFNKTAERVSGYSFEELCGRPLWSSLLLPDEARRVQEGFRRILTEGVPDRYENRWKLKDGSTRLFDWYNSVVRTESGEISFVVSQGYDVTEMRAAQQALADHKQELEWLVAVRTAELARITDYNRMLFQTSPIGLALREWDTLALVDANPAYLQIIGYDEAEARALDYSMLNPPESRPVDDQTMAILSEQGRLSAYEREYVHKQGHRVAVQLTSSLVEQDGNRFILSSVEDISIRKHMEHALRESRANLARAQAIARVGSWRLDHHTKVMDCSDECYRILGIELGVPLSLDDYWSRVHGDDVDKVKDGLRAARGGDGMLDVTHRMLICGELKWVR
ncbi:MAG: PAS domain S-box protein, partial [Gammaproteobacteria bacterium]|nr:PAS domain S-box protein [Gammaproteobacteria bacterium]